MMHGQFIQVPNISTCQQLRAEKMGVVSRADARIDKAIRAIRQ